ncbi:MAG: transporter, partial [Phycisphaerae bacterium]
RCQILPDPTEEQRWPSERYLRQGVRANGWVLLDQVPLWFEAWRQLNGFPPSVDIDSSIDSKKSDDASKSRDGGEDKGKTKLR